MITRVISDGKYVRAAILWAAILTAAIAGALIVWWLA